MNPPGPGQEYPGYSQQGQGYPPVYTPPPATTGFNLSDMMARWRAMLTQPGVAAFDAQQPAANWQAVWIGLTILAVVRAIFGFISDLEFRRAGQPAPGVGSVLGALIGTYLGFFIAVGILHVVARLFNGSGSFLTYAYLLSLVFVPLQIIGSVAGIIPVLGGLVGLAVGIYALWLAVYATASAHRLSTGTSVAVVLIPAIIAFIVFVILAVVAAALLFALGLALPGR